VRVAKWFIALLVPLIGLAVAGLAWADHRAAERIPRGAVVGGVPVGNLTEPQALAKLDQQIGAQARRSATVSLRGRTIRLSAKRAGVQLDIPAAVHRAFMAGREGSFVDRGLRAVRNQELNVREPVHVTVDRSKVRKFVASLARRAEEEPVDAELELSVQRVAVKPGRSGRRLGARELLTKRLVTAMSTPGAPRKLKAKTVAVAPTVTAEKLWDQNPTVVTVSHASKTATVFVRGKVAQRYHVAVGDPKYPTPNGQFVVQGMQKNPTWTVPNSDWAGDLAGQVIPGDDPRNPLVARWIGFDGSVGFHGTKDLASLGRAASHGCVRMDPNDVKDLYERVEVGTTVLVGA
jgi:lipoprotein-anchoring transpeptidase ErfK/SrfK